MSKSPRDALWLICYAAIVVVDILQSRYLQVANNQLAQRWHVELMQRNQTEVQIQLGTVVLPSIGLACFAERLEGGRQAAARAAFALVVLLAMVKLLLQLARSLSLVGPRRRPWLKGY